MKLRDALIQQAPSLALQRAAMIEIAKLDALVAEMACAMEDARAALGMAYPNGGPVVNAFEHVLAKALA